MISGGSVRNLGWSLLRVALQYCVKSCWEVVTCAHKLWYDHWHGIHLRLQNKLHKWWAMIPPANEWEHSAFKCPDEYPDGLKSLKYDCWGLEVLIMIVLMQEDERSFSLIICISVIFSLLLPSSVQSDWVRVFIDVNHVTMLSHLSAGNCGLLKWA